MPRKIGDLLSIKLGAEVQSHLQSTHDRATAALEGWSGSLAQHMRQVVPGQAAGV